MFQLAIEAGADVLPVALRYLDADGQESGCQLCGEITLLQCTWNIVSQPEIHAELILACR